MGKSKNKKEDGDKVKYFEPVRGVSWNYLLGMRDPIYPQAKKKTGDTYEKVQERITYSTNPK